MKITSVQNIFNISKCQNSSFTQKTLAKYPNDIVSFTSKDFISKAYKEFMREYSKQFGDTRLEDIVEIAQKKENIIGRGAEKIVYNFPFIDNFIIGNFHAKEHIANLPIKKSQINLPKYNFGQPILDNGNDIIIMKRIKGHPHSIDDWTKTLDIAPLEEVGISKENKDKFLSSLRIVESFPQSAYTDLAEQIKYLSDNKWKIDSLNPNNILVDEEEKTFTHIDLSKTIQTFSFNKDKPINCVQDMINLLCDGFFQKYYLDVATDSEKEEITKLTKSIIKKSYKSAKEIGLSDDDTNLKIMFDYGRIRRPDRPTRVCIPFYYKQFCNLYKDDIK